MHTIPHTYHIHTNSLFIHFVLYQDRFWPNVFNNRKKLRSHGYDKLCNLYVNNIAMHFMPEIRPF